MVAQQTSPGVSPDIHPDDHIFRFLCEHPDIRERAHSEYFSSGRECALKLRRLIEEHRGAPSNLRLLEFASGYGRVTRHMATVLPEAIATACDIHPQAVRFLAGLGLEAVGSSSVPERFDLGPIRCRFRLVFLLAPPARDLDALAPAACRSCKYRWFDDLHDPWRMLAQPRLAGKSGQQQVPFLADKRTDRSTGRGVWQVADAIRLRPLEDRRIGGHAPCQIPGGWLVRSPGHLRAASDQQAPFSLAATK